MTDIRELIQCSYYIKGNEDGAYMHKVMSKEATSTRTY